MVFIILILYALVCWVYAEYVMHLTGRRYRNEQVQKARREKEIQRHQFLSTLTWKPPYERNF